MKDMSRQDVEKQTADDGSKNTYELEETTKYYHDRNQTSFGSFVSIGSVKNIVYDIVAGDIDNDGSEDFAAVDGDFGKWRNSGDPFTFPSSWSFWTQSPGISISDLGDLDNDGDLDFVSTNGSAVYIFQNPINPGGIDPWNTVWSSVVVNNTPPFFAIVALKFADFDNDGDLDIVYRTNGDVIILENPKNLGGDPWVPLGWFGNTVGLFGGLEDTIEVADLDLDGFVDIITYGVPGVRIWKNDGTPFSGLWADTLIGPPPMSPRKVAVGDLDNDGDIDIIEGDAFGVHLNQNPREVGDPFIIAWSTTSLSTFGGATSLAISDFDNDGWLDIGFSTISDRIDILENGQTPWVGASWYSINVVDQSGVEFRAVTASYLDNDGDSDLIAFTANPAMGYAMYVWNNTLIHRNMPLADSMFISGFDMPIEDIDIGDLDNDGDLDIATTNPGATIAIPTIHVWENDKPWVPASWSTINPIDIGSHGSDGIKVADLDKDGDLDLVTITEDSMLWTVFIWENPLETTDPFTVQWSGGTGVNVGSLTDYTDFVVYLDVGDLDSDGDVDVATHYVNFNTGLLEIRIWRNPLSESGNAFTPGWNNNVIGVPPFPAKGPTSIAVGDLDRDGDADIVNGDFSDDWVEIRIWENPNSTGVDPWSVSWSGATGEQVWIFFNPYPQARIKLSDLDNDGDLDVPFILTAGLGLVKALVNPNDPTTIANEPFTFIPWMNVTVRNYAPHELLSIDVGDMDNDGDHDIVTGDLYSAGPALLRYVAVFTNPLTEGGHPLDMPWSYDEYPILLPGGSGWGVHALALGDLDNRNNTGNNKGSDLDVIHAIENSPLLGLKENIGAQVTEVVTPKSTPPNFYDIFEGTTEDLMRIDVIHNGVWWDDDSELTTWRFLFEDSGVPLATVEAQALFDNMYIYLDSSGDGIWQTSPTDTIVMTISSGSFSLVGGFQTFSFSDPDPNSVITAGTDETYFLVVQLSPTAASATPNTWNVTFDPDGYSSGNWNEVEHEDEDRILTVQYANPTVAGIFRAISGTMPDLIPGNLPIPTQIDVDGLPVTGAIGLPPMSDQIAVPIGTTHSISSVVTNIGVLDTGISFEATYYNCTSSGAAIDPPFYTIILGPLAPGSSTPPFVENWVAPLVVGTDSYVCIFADSSDDIIEQSEINNIYIIHFHTIEYLPPEIHNVEIDGAPTQTYSICSLPPTINLTAIIDDSNTGNSDIGGANYTTSAFGWPGIPMSLTFPPTSPIEEVFALIPTPNSVGTYSYYVYGWDVMPNYNTTSLENATLTVIDDCPPQVQNVLLNGQPTLTIPFGTGPVWVNATLDDTTTGNSNISSANYTIGIQTWPGIPMNEINPPFDNPVEDVTNDPVPIDTSSWFVGIYDICVYGSDELGNNNTTGSCTQLSIAPELIPPEIYNVLIDNSPSMSYGISSLPPTFFLNATIDDEATGSSFIGNVTLGGANYTLGPANWPSSQPMNAVDGTWEDDIAEDVTVIIPTPTTPGIYVYCVYGWDRWFNYNTTGACASLTIVDDLPPEIYNVLLDGSSNLNVVIGTLSVDLTAVLDETNTGQSNIGGANYTVGVQNWSTSVNMDPTDGAWDEIIEDADKTIDISAWTVDTYSICVYGWDSVVNQSNYNVTGSCAQLTIRSAVDLPPTLEAWEPGGSFGQSYTQGDIIQVTWNASDDNLLPLFPINITYGNAPIWNTIATDEADDGSYLWDTSAVSCSGTYWMNLSVYDSAGQTTFDESNYSFDIFCPGDSPPVITAYEPGWSTGQSYIQGSIITVTWIANDDNPLPAAPINITYGVASSWTSIATYEANDQSYSWDTTTVSCPGTYWMNLSVHDSIGQTTFDESNYSFEILCPQIQTEPPEISDVQAEPSPQTVGGMVTISATVTDEDTDSADLTVSVHITDPNGALVGQYPMTYDSGTDRFTHTANFGLEGTYTFVIYAEDEDKNSDSETGSFEMEPELREFNWKPLLALAFTIILILVGLLVSHKRPLRMKGILQKDRLYTFLGGVLPFVIAEAATGLISLFTGLLSIPPLVGAGLIVDLVILIVGIIVCIVIFRKGQIPAGYEKEDPPATSSPEASDPELQPPSEVDESNIG